jgi:GNAT superfamily N-acetyltransferase
MEREYRVADDPDHEAVTKELEERLYEHNSSAVGRRDGSLFAKTIRGEGGKIIGGVAGWTWASACEITLLWVKEGERGKGLGRKLLLAAEEEAKRTKCAIILLRSYSFQAPFFYQKYGYKVEHVLEDFPEGYRYYTLTKTL